MAARPVCAQLAPTSGVVTVALVGDSTVTTQVGWGQAFEDRFGPEVRVLDFAECGRSSKSWLDEGRLPSLLAAKPTYVFIQFGHNDQPGKGLALETDPATTFRENLRTYVRESRGIGAMPVLVSSVERRKYDKDGRIWESLAPWAEAAAAVASELAVPFIDLHAASVAHYNTIGERAAMAFNPKPGDETHCNRTGAEVIVGMIVEQMRVVVPALARHLKEPSQPPL